MSSTVNITSDEWNQWLEYFGKLYPTAKREWLTRMAYRMVRTLGFSGVTHILTPAERKLRLVELKEGLDNIPPDPNNLLMQGGV
jgi:hypothetical protein